MRGELVAWIQEARDGVAGLAINAGAYTHTSVAVHDALRLLTIPIVEVHLSNIFAREEFRHHSYVSAAATGVICGLRRRQLCVGAAGIDQQKLSIRTEALPMDDKFDVDADLVRKLSELLAETGLGEIEYEEAGKRIRVAMAGAAATTIATTPITAVPAASESVEPESQDVEASQHPGAVTSPMVGTIYMSPAPR